LSNVLVKNHKLRAEFEDVILIAKFPNVIAMTAKSNEVTATPMVIGQAAKTGLWAGVRGVVCCLLDIPASMTVVGVCVVSTFS
jgi:hypothetical protein